MRDAAMRIRAEYRGWVAVGARYPEVTLLVGDGRFAKRNGVRGPSPRIETPHPARTSSAPPSPTRGEGKRQLHRHLAVMPDRRPDREAFRRVDDGVGVEAVVAV